MQRVQTPPGGGGGAPPAYRRPPALRTGLGLVAGLFLGASGLLHVFVAWPSIGPLLRSSNVDPGLVSGLWLGWIFGGFAMVACSAVVLHAMWLQWQGRLGSHGPVRIIAGLYAAYTLWAAIVTGGDPFVAAAFGVPAVLLALASWS